ncbi:alpha/beta hydrolase [Virgibacillus siamensis]|uniref:Alpha/beta hydrolase n=1 Tax=Virgibacillus siamensis TaxID=480071 RepID=A0ABN1GM10_9BACI
MKTISNGTFFNIRGKDLYVERHGPKDGYPVLYLHGGPGMGCYEFCYHQANPLSDKVRLIAIDQRGCCRSEMIQEDEFFSLHDIVLDCEALRKELGIDKWTLLGHSFGGFIALKYTTMFPDAVSRILFECPAFDFGLSAKSLLHKTSQIAEKEDMKRLVKECLGLAESDESTRELMMGFIELRPKLGEKGREIHEHNFNHPTDYSFYTEAEWEKFTNRSDVHNQRLMDGGLMFDSLLDNLKNIRQPALLINGQYDPVTCAEQLERFCKDVRGGEVITLQHSGHFPHAEEPEEFTNVVEEFLVREEM